MARSKASVTAGPTALVAASGRLPARATKKKRRTVLTSARRARSGLPGHTDVMKLARGAAAAVSAITVVLDVASQMNSLKNSNRSD